MPPVTDYHTPGLRDNRRDGLGVVRDAHTGRKRRRSARRSTRSSARRSTANQAVPSDHRKSDNGEASQASQDQLQG
jgi:hypothetical protein